MEPAFYLESVKKPQEQLFSLARAADQSLFTTRDKTDATRWYGQQVYPS